MKRKFIRCAFLLCVYVTSKGQDVPIFNTKLSAVYIYNPAIAGIAAGSCTYAYRKSYTRLDGAPVDHLISIQMPLTNRRLAIGTTLLQEQVNFIKNSFLSTAFAYHLPVGRTNTVSSGLSAEYRFFKPFQNSNTLPLGVDPLLENNRMDFSAIDFSFGLNYSGKFLQFGFAISEIADAWLRDGRSLHPARYNGNFQLSFPARNNKDRFEPFANYRKLSDLNAFFETGAYYTISQQLHTGLTFRSTRVLIGSIGFKIKPFLIGYNTEISDNRLSINMGLTHEISVRVDFSERNKKRNYGKEFNGSMNFRRKKTMALHKNGKSPSKHLKKRTRKLNRWSPTRRYQQSTPLRK
jgi:type IX secretion system PorP/SprF family membrane protein